MVKYLQIHICLEELPALSFCRFNSASAHPLLHGRKGANGKPAYGDAAIKTNLHELSQWLLIACPIDSRCIVVNAVDYNEVTKSYHYEDNQTCGSIQMLF